MEAIDPVRYIANRSSGKQGYAIANSLVELGANVTLISGPTNLPKPRGLNFIPVESAIEMYEASKTSLPADIIICVAAVSDWRAETSNSQKIKKTKPGVPNLKLIENPDILKELGSLNSVTGRLVVGFAAETENLIENAKTKRLKKGCDWIIANDVSLGTNIMGGEQNKVYLITENLTEEWPITSKTEVANKLALKIADHFKGLMNDE